MRTAAGATLSHAGGQRLPEAIPPRTGRHKRSAGAFPDPKFARAGTETWNSGKPGVSAAGKIVPSLIAWAACARAGKSAGASGRFLGCTTCGNLAVTGDDFIHQY